MLLISFLFTITAFLLYIVLRVFEAQFKVRKRINVFVHDEKTAAKTEGEHAKLLLRERIQLYKDRIFNFKDRIDEYFGNKISSQKEEEVEKKLLQAGQPLGMTIVDFHVFSIGIKILLPVIFGAYGTLGKLGGSGIFFCSFFGLLLGFFVPNLYINGKIKARYKQALRELPDFLDILTVCLEAGLGFDMALNKVISKKNGILSSEFHTCLEEIRLGKTRKEALSGVKERLEFDELKSLINSILQAEKLGMSFVQIFRIKSQEEREKRKQRAEEEAMKAPVKILFPLVLFIFPSIFIVILGPVVIQMMTQFAK
jgi:tight adherence protein C